MGRSYSYSVMTISPFISLWPGPHGTMQRNENVPTTSVGIVITFVSPAASATFKLSSTEVKLCSPSSVTKRSSRSSPFFAVIVEGVNDQSVTDTSTTRAVGEVSADDSTEEDVEDSELCDAPSCSAEESLVATEEELLSTVIVEDDEDDVSSVASPSTGVEVVHAVTEKRKTAAEDKRIFFMV